MMREIKKTGYMHKPTQKHRKEVLGRKLVILVTQLDIHSKDD